MKFITFALGLALFSSPGLALNYQVMQLCQEQPAYQGNYSLPTSPESVGRASLEIFGQENIPFIGAESGMNSILNTPVGDDDLEIISKSEMRAYGWCYSVDGVVPEKLTDQFMLFGPEHLVWFFAFSHYKDGKWISQCEPVYLSKPAKFCGS